MVALVAPAGYGKTTVLTQWCACTPRRVAWVSLDREDDDPAVLLADLGAALAATGPVDAGLVRTISSPGTSVAAGVARRAAAALASVGEPVLLVLDHSEALQAPDTRDAVAALALRLPPNAQLAVASRASPPLPVARLRAQGAVAEIGVDDLVMDHVEARSLLEAVGEDLAGTDAVDVVRRTEGWPVGIYLAALAARSGTVRAPEPVRLTGDDRAVADYLRSELLARAPADRLSFLTRTSVLERMCGPLCDAVLVRRRSGRMLEELEGANFMLVPLDRRREWYRYHTLFQELLHAELQRREAELVADLHRRAAAWCEDNGAPEMAIYHAQQAGDADTVARLVARIGIPTYASGRHETVHRWMQWFDGRGLVDRYPPVAVLGAIFLALFGQPADAERWAAVAESVTLPDAVGPDGSPMSALLALQRAFLCRDGTERMWRDAHDAGTNLAPGSRWGVGALVLEGIGKLLSGDPDGADALFARVTVLAEQDGAIPSAATVWAERAVIAIDRDDWGEADHVAARALHFVDRGGLEDYAQSALAYAVSARTAVRRGDVAAARLHLGAAVRLRPKLSYALPYYAVQSLLQLAWTYVALADRAGARRVLREARDVLVIRPELGTLGDQAAELRRRLDAVESGPIGASSLTKAELRLIPLLSTHLTYAEIGERLYVSRNTIKTQAMSIYRKLDVTSRSAAIERIEEIGLLGR